MLVKAVDGAFLHDNEGGITASRTLVPLELCFPMDITMAPSDTRLGVALVTSVPLVLSLPMDGADLPCDTCLSVALVTGVPLVLSFPMDGAYPQADGLLSRAEGTAASLESGLTMGGANLCGKLLFSIALHASGALMLTFPMGRTYL